MPTVSVIVPNFNHAQFLHRRIDSILGQTFQDFELILLDDCSTDDSRAILAGYGKDQRVRIEFNETNSGSPFKQWNKGVRLAQGKYVWIAESDDYADIHLLERLVAALDDDPQVAFAYCQSCVISDEDRLNGFADFYLDYLDPLRWKADFCVDGQEECRNYLVSANTVPNASAVVFRRATFESVGGADETFRMCGDWKLWASLALKGKITYLSEPLNFYRHHVGSVRKQSRKGAVDAAEFLRVIRWILGQVTPTDFVLERICRRQIRYWVPAMMSTSVSWSTKMSIINDICAIDPHPISRAVRPAIEILWRKVFSVQAEPTQQEPGHCTPVDNKIRIVQR